MPDILEWRRANLRDMLLQAVSQLAEGHVVIFPTDTSYIACVSGQVPEAVQRLVELDPQATAAPLHLAVLGVGHALEWLPDLPLAGQRLARRVWPGPLTLASTRSERTGLLADLPDVVVDRLLADGRLRLRAPAHEAMLQILQLFEPPLLFRPLIQADGVEVTRPEDIGQPAGVTLVISDGPTYFAQPATEVEIDAEGWKVTAPGVVPEEELRRLAVCQIVFVCTGNTCRSPLAEALCKKILADHLVCTADELPQRGFVVQSAGLSALPGLQASPEAVEIAREYGADLSGHRSQPLTGELLLQADHVLTMTADHLDALAPHGSSMLLPPRLLSCEGEDITDPIGAEPDVYRECARQILHHLQRRLSEFRPA